eukprot:2001402-Prymnesium_polylepis.1
MELDPCEGWTLARGWGLAYAQLGGTLPLPPPDDAFWAGGCLQVQAWWDAHAPFREWRQRAAVHAQQGADPRAAAAAALSAPPAAPSVALMGQPDGGTVAAHVAGL